MDIGHEDLSPFFGGKGIGLIDPGPAMGGPMSMVGDGFDVFIDIRVEMLSPLPVVNSSWNDMPQVRYYTSGNKQLPLGIIINTPVIAEAMCDHFKTVLDRMVPPDPAVDVYPFGFKQVFREFIIVVVQPSFSFGFPDLGRGGKTLQPVEPTV